MERANRHSAPSSGAQVFDFDEALFASCPAETRNELLREAGLLAAVFAPNGEPGALERMALQLSAGDRDAEMGRHHARRLAAALKRLARAA